MANYQNLELIVVYNNSKSEFEKVKGSYNGKLVLITGTTSTASNVTDADKKPYIYASDDIGNGKYIAVPYSYLVGFKAGNTIVAAPDKLIEFAGANGIGVSISGNTLTISGADIVGTSTDKSNQNTIYGAKKYAEEKAGAVLGTTNDGSGVETVRGTRKLIAETKAALEGSSTDTENSTSIVGAKKYTDKAIENLLDGETISDLRDDIEELKTDKADLENGKIPTSQLPDYILGQLLFGGTINSGTSTTMVITPSTNYRNKHTVPASQSTTTVQSTDAANHEGEYFISSFGGTAVGIPVAKGDWIVSTGTEWKKIDNTDAIATVAGVAPANGNISKEALITTLGIDKKYEKPSTGIPESDLANEVQTSLGLADSSIQSVDAATPNYITVQKPGGTPYQKEITAITKEITSMTNTDVGLATTEDVRAFLKACLSIKIVNPS